MQNLVDIPETLQATTELTQRTPAKQGNSSGIAVVDSAAQLEQLNGPKMAMLLGYREESTKGGGTFIYQPEGTGLRIGEWLLQPGQTVTPYHFGALESGLDDDSGEALQRFFDFCAAPSARDYQIHGSGSFGTSIPLIAANMGYVYGFDMSILGLAPMDDVLTIKTCRGSIWVGKLNIKVSHDQWLSKRVGVNGVRIEDSRGAKLCNFHVSRGSGWGVYFGAGNNNMCTVGDVFATDMGATGKTSRSHLVRSMSFSDNDKNTIHQYTDIMLSPESVIPSDAHLIRFAFWVSAIGEVYKIREVDRETNAIRVYPRVPDAEKAVGDNHLVFGGAVCCYSGGHTAKAKLGHVSAMRSGIGLWLTGQSSANVEGYTGQFCGIDMVLGSNPENSFGGSFIGSVYFEASEFADLIHANQTRSFSNGTIFGSSAGLDTRGWRSLSPKGSDWTPGNTEKQYLPISFMDGGYLWGQGSGDELSHDSDRYTVTASSRSGVTTAIQPTRHTTELHLRTSDDAEKFVGILPITVHLYGRQGLNGSYHSSMPVTCEEGYTINGEPGPLHVPNYDAPITLHALLERGKNWIVTFTEHQTL